MFEDDRKLFALRSRINVADQKGLRLPHPTNPETFAMQRHTRLSIGLGHECCTKAPAPSRLVDALNWLRGSRLCLVLQFMDEGKVCHHHAKSLGPIHSAENLSSDPLQFVGNLERQGEHKCGVDSLKWNVQPLVVVKRNELRLSSPTLKTHNDMLSEGVLFPDFHHSKELIEMALGESGIYCEPELSARLCRSNDSALRSCCGFLRNGHVGSLFWCILQHRYMRFKDYASRPVNKGVHFKGAPG